MNKLSAYQKLKQENQRLREALHTVVMTPDSSDAALIKSQVCIQVQTEQSVFAGSYNNTSPCFDGLIKTIDKTNNKQNDTAVFEG